MRPLLDVFIDAGCDVLDGPAQRALSARRVDILSDAAKLDRGVLLLGARTIDGASSLEALKELRLLNQQIVVCLAVRPEQLLRGMVARYTHAGLDRLYFISLADDVQDMVSSISRRVLAMPCGAAIAALPQLGLDGWPLRLTLHAFRNARSDESLVEVAQRFGKQLRTMEDYLLRAKSPELEDLYRCGRYAHLGELELLGIRDRAECAQRLGFPNSDALRKWVWRLREKVGRDERLNAFVSRIASLHPLLPDGEADL